MQRREGELGKKEKRMPRTSEVQGKTNLGATCASFRRPGSAHLASYRSDSFWV